MRNDSSTRRAPAPLLYSALALAIGFLVVACGPVPSAGPQTAAPPATSPQATSHPAGPTATATASPTASHGIIAGRVVSGSNCPATSANDPCPGQPAVGYRVTIRTPGGAVVGVATTDSNGHFMLTVAPGTYVVQPAGDGGKAAVRVIPSGPLSVAAGAVSQVQIILETGAPVA